MTNKKKVENWLDAQIKMKQDGILRINKKIKLQNLSVISLSDIEIHISEVRYIADLLGLEIISKPWVCKGSNYNCEVYFMYKGYKFFDLAVEEEV